MQEKFVLKTVKRIAAISTGVAMLGATLTGALAAPQLKEYPSPFVKSGVYDDANVFTVGDSASAEDVLGLVDISTNLQFLAKTPVSTSGAAVTVTGGQSKQVPLGMTLKNTSDLFDAQMDRGDVSSLFKGKINFRGTDYDVEEQLQFRGNTGRSNEPAVQTSLASSDDDYKTDVALEFQRDTISYAYRFIDSLSAADMGNVSTSHKMKINMLGVPLRLTSVSATSLTAQVGEEHFMSEGDTLTFDGKVVKLEAVGSSSAVVSVDGDSQVVTSGDSLTINGVEVTVDSVISKTNKGESSSVLVIGKDSSETYNDGDAFPGEDKDSPKWVWDIRGMVTTGQSDYLDYSGAADVKVLRVENDIHYEDDSDKPPKVGECLSLPNDYLQICLDSLTVADDSFKELEMKYESSSDFSDEMAGNTSVPAIRIWFPVDDGLSLPAYTAGGTGAGVSTAYSVSDDDNDTAAVKTKEVWLYRGDPDVDAGLLRVYYRDYTSTPNKVRYHGGLYGNASTGTDQSGKEILELNYDNTKSTNMVLEAGNSNLSTSEMNLTWDINGDTTNDLVGGTDDLLTKWGLSSGKFHSLGATASTEEGAEVVWGATTTGTNVNVGSKDEDHRMLYGVKLLNPKSSSSSDKVRLVVPNDQVKANVVIKGKSAQVSSGGVSYVPAKVTAKTMLASEVTDPTKYNLIVVGGPCANPLAETLFGVSCDGWSLQEGEAMVKLVDNGNKVALLVAGTTATDTRRAAKAVANSEVYLKDVAKSEAVVKGATLSDVNVE